MADHFAAVALLFDDDALAAPLREALQSLGARIVHEGPLGAVTADILRRSGAVVVVVNLRDEDDAAFERLHAAIDGDHPRLVLNEAAASGALDGWERARWARHLASKVLAVSEVDPPRPPAPHGRSENGDLGDEAPPASMLFPAMTLSAGEPTRPAPSTAGTDGQLSALASQAWPDGEPASVAGAARQSLDMDDGSSMIGGRRQADSDTLADELASLLAADQGQPMMDDDYGPGPAFDASLWLDDTDTDNAAMHVPPATLTLAPAAADERTAEPTPDHVPQAHVAAGFSLDNLQLAPLDETPAANTPVAAIGTPASEPVHQAPSEWGLLQDDAALPTITQPAVQVAPKISATAPIDTSHIRLAEDAGPLDAASPTPAAANSAFIRQPPADWGLVDDDADIAPSKVETVAANAYGSEQFSAAEIPAGREGTAPASLEIGPGLALVSLEEASAPPPYQAALDSEMLLDPERGHLRRVVALVADAHHLDALQTFLAVLPLAPVGPVVLITRGSIDFPRSSLASGSLSSPTLPLRVAEPTDRASREEILLIPAASTWQLRRDGTLQWQPVEQSGATADAAEASFSALADRFAADLLIIILADIDVQSLAIARAVSGRGGQVWMEARGEDRGTTADAADLMALIQAEKLATLVASPATLAKRLKADFREGAR